MWTLRKAITNELDWCLQIKYTKHRKCTLSTRVSKGEQALNIYSVCIQGIHSINNCVTFGTDSVMFYQLTG